MIIIPAEAENLKPNSQLQISIIYDTNNIILKS